MKNVIFRLLHGEKSFVVDCLMWLICVTIGYYLVVSAFVHIGNPYQFLATMYLYNLVPQSFAVVLAAVLPFVHLAVCLNLVLARQRQLALLCGALLFFVYGVAQSWVWARGATMGCGCFGPSSPGSSETPIGIGSISIAFTLCLASWLGWCLMHWRSAGASCISVQPAAL